MRTLTCARCGFAISPAVLRDDAPFRCPSCRVTQHTEVFPALFDRAAKGAAPEKAFMEEDARCFNHPDKIAVTPCSECGIYLCDLCDIEADGVHLCPKCFKTKRAELDKFVSSTTVYDDFFLTLALLPIIFSFLTIVTAPVLLVCAFLLRKKIDSQPYAKVHWKYYAAIVIAVLQIIFWLFLLARFVMEK